MKSTSPLMLLVWLSIISMAARADAAQWPQFRGPGSRGIADHSGLPTSWSDTENVAWKTEIPGRGWSSPVVWNDLVFVTTVVNEGQSEEPRKGLYFGGDRPTPPDSNHEWVVLCLDLSSGKTLWKRTVHRGKPTGSIHLKNSFASETPIVDGERVYCYFGNVGVFCFTLAGEPVWDLEIKSHKTRYGWGTAASPVLHDGVLYIVNDNEEDSYLLALDAETGKQFWKVPRDEKSNWATPYVWENAERTEIVTPGTGQVRSYGLDGQLLWSLKGMSSITIATPYAVDGLLYVSSGYVLDRLKPLYAIRPGAMGDISLPAGETGNEWIVWSRPDIAPYNPTSLIYGQQLYVLYDRGLIASFDAGNGQPLSKLQRIPNGRAFTASPWAYNGRIYCLNEDGVTFVYEAGTSGTPGSELKLLGTNRLADDDMCMATPALAGDRLLIRTSERIYCIRATTDTP